MSRPDASPDPLRRRYADLLPPAGTDPVLARLVRDLDDLSDVPAPAHVRARIGRALIAEATKRYEQRGEFAAARGRAAPRPRRIRCGRTSSMAIKESPRIAKAFKVRRLALMAAAILLGVLLLSGGGAFALSRLDPGLAKQLGIPVATGPEYTELEITHTVGDVTITLSRAALTTKKAIIGYTYEVPSDGSDGAGICPLTLTSGEGDTFRAFAVDQLGQGVKDGVAHGSTVMYFAVEHLASGDQERHLHLVLTPCDVSHANYPDKAVAFDFALPLQTSQTAAD